MSIRIFHFYQKRAALAAIAILVWAVSLPASAQQSKSAPETGIYASGQQLASLRPGHGLTWQRTSPTVQQPDGPVLYQLLFNASGTPGTVAAFDTNPRHLTNSPITVSGGNVVIGGGNGVVINGTTGIISFTPGQTFPASGLPNLAGEVTGPPGTTVVSNAVATSTANAIVRRDDSGNFSAASITLGGNLALPNTASASVGVLTLGGTPFLHNFGVLNTFAGASAGNLSLSGFGDTGVGSGVLQSDTTGYGNSAFGASALFSNTIGANNSAFGNAALGTNSTGGSNAAFGTYALASLSTGSNNIAVGTSAGSNLTGAESNNIDIGHSGMGGESNTIRIGTAGTHTAAFIAGISGATSASGVNVFVNSAGQLGTATSSRRFKQDIADLGAESDVLLKLRPVAFYYKPELDSTHARQYGLVAEEVAQIAPGLVVFDEEGKPQTVRYHFVNAMLLNEVQKQRRLIEDQQKQLEALQHQIAELLQRVTQVEQSRPQLAGLRH